MERIAAGKPPLIFGDGAQTMDFVYIGDIARANMLAAEADVTDDVFNVASGVETSLLELAEMLLRVMGSDLAVEHGPERAGQRRHAPPGRHRAGRASELGFEAEVDLEEGLTRLVEWWRAERAGAPDAADRARWRGRRDGGPVQHARTCAATRAPRSPRSIATGLGLPGPARARVRGGASPSASARADAVADDELHDRAAARAVRRRASARATR